MGKRRIRKNFIFICLLLILCHPVYAQAESGESEENQTQGEVRSEVVEIPDQEVPLNYVEAAGLIKYKRDVAVMIFFGGVVVTTTVVATIKENKERKKLN